MQFLLALALSLAAIANPPAEAPPAWRSALPLWTLSAQAHAAIYTGCPATDAGVAVIDLRTGDRWIAGNQSLRPIRSVVKAPIALLSLLDAETSQPPNDDPPTPQTSAAAADAGQTADQTTPADPDPADDQPPETSTAPAAGNAPEEKPDQASDEVLPAASDPPPPSAAPPFNLDAALSAAVVHGNNDAATALLRRAGNMPALRDLYRTLNLDRLANQAASGFWGLGQANPADLADLAADLARSPEIPEPVRARLLDLLISTRQSQRWGIINAPPNHWNIAVRTGFWPDEEQGQALNSIAIWIPRNAPPRYAAAIMLQDRSPEKLEAWTCQTRITAPLAQTLHRRAAESPASPAQR